MRKNNVVYATFEKDVKAKKKFNLNIFLKIFKKFFVDKKTKQMIKKYRKLRTLVIETYRWYLEVYLKNTKGQIDLPEIAYINGSAVCMFAVLRTEYAVMQTRLTKYINSTFNKSLSL